MAPTMTHLAMHVKDLSACIDFYERYWAMYIAHDRDTDGHRVVWLAEKGREREFILVLMPGGPGRDQQTNDYSHLGVALESREAVVALAEKARAHGMLVWEPVDEPYPVGYYCEVRDPDGIFVEFSDGQPLGPGSETARVD